MLCCGGGAVPGDEHGGSGTKGVTQTRAQAPGGGGAADASATDQLEGLEAMDPMQMLGPILLAPMMMDPSVRPAMLPPVIRDSVFKLMVTHVMPNYSLPWQQRRQQQSTSTAFLIGNKRVLTNAHCVEDATVVKIKRRNGDTKYIAKVLAVAHECDLALLEVPDEEFHKGLTAIDLAPNLPQLEDRVAVVGYPLHGDNQSITQGVVSRMDLHEYSQSGAEFLAVQIDAAINSGNSGGPVLAGSPPQCVGIAFEANFAAENVGYIIPVPVVQRFLADIEKNSRYTGFASLGLEWQTCENPSLRAFTGMSDGDTGVRVMRVNAMKEPAEATDTDATAKVVANDILTSFDGTPIANDGSIAFEHLEQRIEWTYLLSYKFVGDVCDVDVIREGKKLTVKVRLQDSTLLVPTRPGGKAPPGDKGGDKGNRSSAIDKGRTTPPYAIVGGLCFVTLSESLLRSEFGVFSGGAPIMLIQKLMFGRKEDKADEVVVLNQVLAHAVNVGYEDMKDRVVDKFNGEKIRNLKHLMSVVHASKDEYLHFEMAPFGEAVVLDRKAALQAEKEILGQHNIPAPMSADIKASIK